jgi:sugar-specific transcriptional regulator TrmB
MIELLQKIGLEDKEIAIYTACLEHNLNTPTDIARQTGIKRTTVYFYLGKLLNKGLIAQKVKKAKKYIVCPPPKTAIRNYLKNQKEQIFAGEKLLESLPTDKINILTSLPTQVFYYEGKEGVRTLINNILAEKENIYWFGSMENILSVVDEEQLYHLFTLKRMVQNTSSYALTDRHILKYKRFSEQLGNFRFFKFLDKNFDIPALLVLFGNTISLVSINGGNVKTIIIKDRVIHEMVKFLFLSYWDCLPEEKPDSRK